MFTGDGASVRLHANDPRLADTRALFRDQLKHFAVFVNFRTKRDSGLREGKRERRSG